MVESSRKTASNFLKGIENEITNEQLERLQNFLEEYYQKVVQETKKAAIERINQMIII